MTLSEAEEMLRIIKEKEVHINLIVHSWKLEFYNKKVVFSKERLTDDEFKLLKKYFHD